MARTLAATGRAQRERPFAADIFGIFTPFLNRYIVHIAGGRYVPFWALLRHRGRRSGRDYATPVTARRVSGGFAVPVSFGLHSDWFQNIMASRVATIRWSGREYPLVDPEPMAPDSAILAFPGWQQTLFRALGIDRFLFLRDRDA